MTRPTNLICDHYDNDGNRCQRSADHPGQHVHTDDEYER